MLYFGVLSYCSICHGQLYFNNTTYSCSKFEYWGRCSNNVKKEAPSTGYMFGKGIYFADIVSKSAKYCATGLIDKMGLLLLCDVALGKSRLAAYAQDFANEIPNENEHSVKGCGSTYPTEFCTLDGVKIASGGLCKTSKTSLKYNEYIVYDINQVKMKYLVKVKFNYK